MPRARSTARDRASSPGAAADELLVELDRAAGGLQRQLEERLREAVRGGRLAAGARLPASRALAADLGVSRGVVSDAYAQLGAEGWLALRDRAAPRVAAAVGATPAPPAPGPGAPAPPAFDLRPGRPDLAAFPRREYGRSLARVLARAPDEALAYPPAAGLGALRAALAAHRARVRGTRAGAGDVVVTAGTGQALMAVADAVRARGGRRIAVEDPGHADIRAMLAARGLEPVPVPVDAGGLRADRLPDDAAAVLVTPAHQFPLGVVLAPGRRAELLAWADARGALVVEDDYDAEFRYDRAPVGALQGVRPDLVAHLGSVSKTLAPGLRLGWLVAPAAWAQDLLAAKARLDHGLPALEQLAFADFVDRGAYDRHLRRAAREHRRRRDALLAALAERLPTAEVSGAAAGLHVALRVGAADEARLVRACGERGVTVDGLARHRVAPAPPGDAATLLLSFAAIPPAAAARVARLLAAAASAAG